MANSTLGASGKARKMRDMGGSNHGYGWLHQIYTVTQSLFRAIGSPHGLIVFEDSENKVLPPQLVGLASPNKFQLPVGLVKGKAK